ncbi:hypothetical protein M422DRAFT_276988 [Sphaerobolus stellatus SS14]|uniref:P-type H(+)-exporting transporter n=1 Tax=Sphaerobolus stellatus (strain SS14) TaxID=990650 RepID=A0A0C9TL15_SPHS4|nr:hypothetical protein M422DRAFT_276988 [Sphaerobolus stellatus SS14]
MLKGLDDEVAKRRLRFGYNELESPHANPFLKFLSYFQGPILYVMEIAVLLAAGLRDWVDFDVIIGILALNTFVGWYQENRIKVVRDGQEQDIEARDIVPGDIVIVEETNTIPADGKILASYDDKDRSKAKAIEQKIEVTRRHKEIMESQPKQTNMTITVNETDDEGDEKGPSVLSVNQSVITGESLTVDKFIGDTCQAGKCYVLVTQIARHSFVGKTAALVTGSSEKGHFESVMSSIGTTLLLVVILWVTAVWIGSFFRHVGIATPDHNNLLVYALIFLIIGVPVGLPCVTKTTLAVGAAYLARKNAIMQKLSAIESLAGVDILASDKTGTLTANQLSLHEPWVAEGVDANWMMCVAALASSHNVKSLDPIDHVLREGWHTIKFTPFDPVSKQITAKAEKGGKRYACAKGAPNVILKLCNPSQHIVDTYHEMSNDFAQRGIRSLGVAVKESDGSWQILGLLPMFDPPRHDTTAIRNLFIPTIGEAQKLGIKVKMLTGDAVAIAKETCRMLNLGTNVYDFQRLIGGNLAGSDIHDFVEGAEGFAKVFPEHKYQVVRMLQDWGHLTAMIGDGTFFFLHPAFRANPVKIHASGEIKYKQHQTS